MAISAEAGSEALHRLKATDPPQWLAPSATLSQTAREASQNLFSSLRPYTPKSPFDKLLVEGFDAEQIWQQIDLQSQPLISSIRRELKRFEKDPEEIKKLKLVVEGEENGLEDGREKLEDESDEFDEDLDGIDEELEEDEDEDEEEEEESGDEDEDEKEKDEEEDNSGGEFEDEFLKIKDLEEFMEDDEAREYGLNKKDKKKKKKVDEDSEEEDEEKEEEDDDSDEIGDFGLDDDDEDGETDKLEGARYEDFFVGKKKNRSKRKSKFGDRDDDEGNFGTNDDGSQNEKTLSTHEKELEKLKSKIELMEKANLEPKTWTMQGEVSAAKRPKNSALEVDLDFEHNVRPPPVITEEVTASLEEMIKKRILEGHFDDVEKPLPLPSKAPREKKELDENKSKKGLAEIYEEEYVQKTNVASTLPFVEEEKQEASMLFKKLCLKLDALSHFHFTPKPVIEDMSIQANVPALAMEEIAPLAVSDAAMLAPEEVFLGKGDIKEEAELTQEERKRRRANKKRKFKAETEKKMANKPRDKTLPNPNDAEVAKKARDGT
ncbi:M phase phosphoprotein 10 [Humulus lupulus]|uniref:M phase phosphoprotein 10 n=1 Tax=Humulus lupulus TaxID=3486 RepID=UPI002B407701|nr:M phase phosphoprotein 10 [Humulus lupulus]